MFCTTSMLEKVSQIHKTYLLDQQLFCWRHFSKTEVVQNTDVNILALYCDFFSGIIRGENHWDLCLHIFITFFWLQLVWWLFFLSEDIRSFIFIKNCSMKLNNNLSTSEKFNGQNNAPFCSLFSVSFPFCVLNK